MITICPNKNAFSDHWIQYCTEKKIPFEIIDVYKGDLYKRLKNSKVFLWDYNHENFSASLFDKQLISVLNKNEVLTFPHINDLTYYDDKISQTYLLERLAVKHPETFISYDKNDALQYIDNVQFPLVAKLRKGAGGINVFKFKHKKEAIQYINVSFGKGHRVYDQKRFLQDRLGKLRSGVKNKKSLIRILVKSIFPKSNQTKFPREKGYVYFQKYIENNGFDFRVVVINQNKAFSAKRISRPNDFRSSGSGVAEYPNDKMPKEYILEAFNIAKKLNSLCVAIDFVHSTVDDKIYTIEISHYYDPKSMKPCKGFWTEEFKWREDSHDPQYHLMGEIMNRLID